MQSADRARDAPLPPAKPSVYLMSTHHFSNEKGSRDASSSEITKVYLQKRCDSLHLLENKLLLSSSRIVPTSLRQHASFRITHSLSDTGDQLYIGSIFSPFFMDTVRVLLVTMNTIHVSLDELVLVTLGISFTGFTLKMKKHNKLFNCLNNAG